jgi:hypothetical protein
MEACCGTARICYRARESAFYCEEYKKSSFIEWKHILACFICQGQNVFFSLVTFPNVTAESRTIICIDDCTSKIWILDVNRPFVQVELATSDVRLLYKGRTIRRTVFRLNYRRFKIIALQKWGCPWKINLIFPVSLRYFPGIKFLVKVIAVL